MQYDGVMTLPMLLLRSQKEHIDFLILLGQSTAERYGMGDSAEGIEHGAWGKAKGSVS